MEVVGAHSNRLVSHALASFQQLDAKLIAFYTLLTVALTLALMSLNKQSRTFRRSLGGKVRRCLKYTHNYSAISSVRLSSRLLSTKLGKLKRLSSLTPVVCGWCVRKIRGTTSGGSGVRIRGRFTASTASLRDDTLSAVATQQFIMLQKRSMSAISFPSALNMLGVEESEKGVNSKIRLYKKLPWRSMSRAWGELNQIDLPVWCRAPCYQLYSWMFNCNLAEMENENLRDFKNLSEFFRRTLKPHVRHIDRLSCLASPCDGKILHFGKVDKGYLEQVKGVNYSLQAFLGAQTWPKNEYPTNATSDSGTSSPRFHLSSSSSSGSDTPSDSNSDSSDSDFDSEDSETTSGSGPYSFDKHAELYEKTILTNPVENCLYHCVIYLAPGDYHRFHSPTDWEIFYRRHFPGELFSVNPSVARWLQGLFNLNERVVYYGEWKYGFFSMTAVGATNVGSIKVYMDETLSTNNKRSSNTFERDLDKNFSATNEQSGVVSGVPVQRGHLFGEFNLGSTIVLIFEAPKNFEFNIEQNQKVFFGGRLGSACSSSFI